MYSESICGVIRYKAILADSVSKTPLVLNEWAFDTEFLEAVVILPFIEATNVLQRHLLVI